MPKTNKDHQKIMKLEEEIKDNDSKEKEKELNRKIDELRLKIQEFENIQKENDENLDKLSDLYKLGIIDENGFVINNRMD